jgi:hypothetical protein
VRKVKLFKGVENELTELEAEINQFLESSGVELISVSGNISPQTHLPTSPDTFSTSDVLIILTYEASGGQ